MPNAFGCFYLNAIVVLGFKIGLTDLLASFMVLIGFFAMLECALV